jgi:3-hydroxy-9,10-secoandrosta-1,3,5(10)-triene-9,17-dione monooxygenase
MYLGQMMGPYHASLVTPVIGAARAAIDEYEAIIAVRPTNTSPPVLSADHADYQRPLGLAIAQTDAAEAILFSALDSYMAYCARWSRDGTPFSLEENLRLWAMIQQAGRLACESVEQLFAASGSTAARGEGRMRRYVSDAAMYRGHISSQFQSFATYVGRARLGRELGFMGL